MVRSACCGWAGALLSCCSECLCWTREGVTETPTTTACLLGLAVVGAAAETLRCSFLSFEYSYCLIPTAAKAVLGFILHQQRWLFAVGLFCVWPFAPAALLSSTSWSAEPKLCSIVFKLSKWASPCHIDLFSTWKTGWKNHLGYLKTCSHNTCFIGNKYSKVLIWFVSAELAWRCWTGCPWCHSSADNA